MTTNQIRIMFYDEQQKQWVTDTMVVADENSGTEESEQTSEDETDSSTAHVMAYL